MFHLLVVAFLLAGRTAGQDLEADESAPIQVYSLDEVHHAHHYDRGRQDQEPHNVYLHEIRGHKGQSKVDRIVSELYNPDYYEPIRVLDYRYVKSGGRDYARDAGGQILILPKNVRLNQKKEFGNYDELLEFLRLKQIAELEAQKLELSKLGYHDIHDGYHKQRIEITGQNHHQHQRNHYQHRHGGTNFKRGAQDSPQKAKPVESEKTV